MNAASNDRVTISRRALEQLVEDAMSHLAYWGDDEPPPWHIAEAREALTDGR